MPPLRYCDLLLRLIVLLLLARVAILATGAIEECNFKSHYRLPERRIQPRHYELLLDPDLKRKTFVGRLNVDFEVGDIRTKELIGNNQIVLQVKWLHLEVDETKLSLQLNSSKSIEISSVCRDMHNEKLVVICSENLLIGSTGKINLEFQGKFRTDFQGLYLTEYTSYTDDNEQITTQFLSTQFESTDARSVFPCFDEPKFKATLRLSLLLADGLTALGNMDQAVTRRVAPISGSGNTNLIQFANTPPLSTYMMAFAVGHFDYLEKWIGGNLRVRVHTLPGRQQDGRLALEVTLKGIELLEREFGVKFPGNKIDLAAIPNFRADAMENYGLILSRPNRLLYNDRWSPIEDQLMVVVITLHELVHQWMGHLLTINWWSELWVKEGVANFMGFYFAGKLYPQLFGSTTSLFVMQDVITAIDLDASSGADAKPVARDDLTNSALVEGAFDSTTYHKGAALVRWAQQSIGEREFALTLRDFIGKNLNATVTGKDLMRALDPSGNRISLLLGSWLRNASAPKLRVDYNRDSNELTVEQQSQESSKRSGNLWYIIGEVQLTSGSLARAGDQSPLKSQVIPFEIQDNQSRLRVKLPDWFAPEPEAVSTFSYLKLNPNFTAIYQVEYSDSLCDQMHPAIELKLMQPIDRLNVVSDCLPPTDEPERLIEFLNSFKQEDDALVLHHLFSQVQRQATDKTIIEKLMHTADHFVTKFDSHGTKTETRMHQMFRGMLFVRLLELEHKPSIEEALKLGELHELPAQFLRQGMRLAVAKFGTEAQFDLQLKLAKETRIQEDQKLAWDSFTSGILSISSDSDAQLKFRRLNKMGDWLAAPEVHLDNKSVLARQLVDFKAVIESKRDNKLA